MSSNNSNNKKKEKKKIIPWNKGMRGTYSKKYLKRMSQGRRRAFLMLSKEEKAKVREIVRRAVQIRWSNPANKQKVLDRYAAMTPEQRAQITAKARAVHIANAKARARARAIK